MSPAPSRATTPWPGAMARGADRRGVEIHQQTEVLGIRRARRRASRACEPLAGYIAAPKVSVRRGRIHAANSRNGGSAHADLRASACRPWCPSRSSRGSIPSSCRDRCTSTCRRRARGELVMGASLDPYELHSTRSTLDFVEGLAAHMLDLFPFLSRGEGEPAMGGPRRHDAGFRAHHGRDARSRASFSMRAGAPGDSRPRRCAARPWPHRRDRAQSPFDRRILASTDSRATELTGEKGAASVGH